MGKLYRDLVRQHSQAKGSARAVLNALADYAKDDGTAWPGRDVLAAVTGLSERTVIRALQSLRNEGRLEVVENAAGGRGRKPCYRILFPDGEKGDNPPAERVTNCPLKGDNVTVKGDILTQKGDKLSSDSLYARSEPQEPKEEPKREPARALPSHRRAGSARDKITFKSPHVDKSRFDLDTGYIAAGRGATAVEVYYERFDVQQDMARLNAPKEDDLVRHCKDLDLLREVVTAYSQTTYQPGNVRLILDWYKRGIPDKYRLASVAERRSNSALFLNYAADNGVFYGRT